MSDRGAWWREPTRRQWLAFATVWVGWVLDAFDFTVFLLVMPQLAAEFGVTIVTTAGSISITLLVRLLGGVLAGMWADRFGRKGPLVASVVWFAACNGLVAVAPSFGWVLVLRTLFGLGMGAEWTAGVALAMESWPERSRGIASGLLQGGWAVGYLLAALASVIVLPVWGWRGLFLLGLAPAALALPMRWWVPESPALLQARRQQAQRRPPWRELLASLRLRGAPGRAALWATVTLGLGFSTYYSFASLHSTMLQRDAGLRPQEVGWPIACFNVGMLVGTVLFGWLAQRFGPRRAIALAALGVVGAAPLFAGWGGVPHWLGAGAAGLAGAGSAGVTPLLLAQLFPVEVRARASGFVYHAAAFAAGFTPLWLAALVAWAGRGYAPVLAAAAVAFALAQAVWITLFSPTSAAGP